MSYSNATTLWPGIRTEFLTESQFKYEASIRNIGVDATGEFTQTPANIQRLNDAIATDGDPLRIPYGQRHEVDFTRCKNEVNVLKTSIDKLSGNVVLHRCMHLWYRMMRLDDQVSIIEGRRHYVNVIESIINDALTGNRHGTQRTDRSFDPGVHSTLQQSDGAIGLPHISSGHRVPGVNGYFPPGHRLMRSPPPNPNVSITIPNVTRQASTIPTTMYLPSSLNLITTSAPSVPYTTNRSYHGAPNDMAPLVNYQHVTSTNGELIPGVFNEPLVTRAETIVTQHQWDLPRMNLNQPNPATHGPQADFTLDPHNVSAMLQRERQANREMQQQMSAEFQRQMRIQLQEQRTELLQMLRPNVAPLERMEQRVASPIQPVHHDDAFRYPDQRHDERFEPEYRTHPRNHDSRFNRSDEVDKKLRNLSRWNCMFEGASKEGKNQTLEEYTGTLKAFMKAQQISGAELMSQVATTLTGEARLWYLSVTNQGDVPITFEYFIQALKDRFADKRSQMEMAQDLMTTVLEDTTKILSHIDGLAFKMDSSSYAWTQEQQLDIIKMTLPKSIRNFVVTRETKTVEELKRFCQTICPPKMRLVTPKAKPEFRKSVSAIESKPEAESEIDSDTEYDVYETVKTTTRNPKFDRTKKMRTPVKSEVKTVDEKPRKSDNGTPKIAANVLEGNQAVICFQCRSYGHSHNQCVNTKTFDFCYRCGRPNETTQTCNTSTCVAAREQKNE